jgi:glycosyltransferase involved in cell wall biosynthesis
MMASVRWYNAAAAYAVETAHGLRERGHAVHLVMQPGSPGEAEARRRSLPVVSAFDLTDPDPKAAFANLRRLRRVIMDVAPHVINAHRSEDHLFAALALRGSGRPLVRTRGDVRPPRTHLANRVLYGRKTAAHIACADFMPRRFFPPLGIDPGRVVVIRPGLDPERFAAGAPEPGEARRRLGLDPEARWVGLVGRWTAAKGHSVLLRAVAALRREPPPRLLLTGVANEIGAGDLLGEAAALGIADRVRLAPPVSDVRDALRAVDVLAVPSVASEAIARIALEGLALGIPTVASDLNSLPEIVGDAGLLVPPGDVPGLAAALAAMLDSPGLRERARVRGPARIARRYHRGTALDRTESLFRRVAGDA